MKGKGTELGGTVFKLVPIARVKNGGKCEPMEGQKRGQYGAQREPGKLGHRLKGVEAGTDGACEIRNGIWIGVWVSKGL